MRRDENCKSLIQLIEEETSSKGPDIKSLIMEERYVPYRNISDRVVSYLDYFNISYVPEDVRKKIGILSIWIKTVDDRIDDFDCNVGIQVLERLRDKSEKFDSETETDEVLYLTELLKKQIEPDRYDNILKSFTELYHAVNTESNSPDIKTYIKNRKRVGRLTAKLFYEIIEPGLQGGLSRFKTLFIELGELGNMADAAVDLNMDKEQGILKFNPRLKDHMRMYMDTIYMGAKTIVKYPGLVSKFYPSIKNCVKLLLS
ncbi:hypothetical protein CEE44_00545 [Candidatus Woesearchaeota archaeon B3_Woes]|nr:MAG: hypothetical protein CEE44_00545 [Candidatus Woesearchaeota archaeon B3_Woes]